MLTNGDYCCFFTSIMYISLSYLKQEPSHQNRRVVFGFVWGVVGGGGEKGLSAHFVELLFGNLGHVLGCVTFIPNYCPD